MKKVILILGIVVVVALIIIGINFAINLSKPDTQVACTMEAKICPDGSAVGRSGPRCEFAKCPPSQVKQSPEPATNDVVLSVGQNVKVGTLGITLDSIVEDSRCPSDVQCVWAGRVGVKLSLLNGTKSESVNLSPNQDAYLFDNYSIKIVSVDPVPKSGKEISVGEYRVTVSVE
jgi:hypothetical protein